MKKINKLILGLIPLSLPLIAVACGNQAIEQKPQKQPQSTDNSKVQTERENQGNKNIDSIEINNEEEDLETNEKLKDSLLSIKDAQSRIDSYIDKSIDKPEAFEILQHLLWLKYVSQFITNSVSEKDGAILHQVNQFEKSLQVLLDFIENTDIEKILLDPFKGATDVPSVLSKLISEFQLKLETMKLASSSIKDKDIYLEKITQISNKSAQLNTDNKKATLKELINSIKDKPQAQLIVFKILSSLIEGTNMLGYEYLAKSTPDIAPKIDKFNNAFSNLISLLISKKDSLSLSMDNALINEINQHFNAVKKELKSLIETQIVPQTGLVSDGSEGELDDLDDGLALDDDEETDETYKIDESEEAEDIEDEGLVLDEENIKESTPA
ncbi:hypothetical protein MCAL160_0215 [Mycoplasmopsis californica HAZ160_1]|uniref:Lipoprotein n=1 Tax=Mycoplasmopsis californica HAZ160_1 TaxID=1397850 RepID=A0AAT9F7N7_9BACT|nr:hypothetical protein [Mycoplasmopsis californica]BAP00903.1 hypothetical protein MCAL160_0215 [Mycoplasmopsis californica HAZ160_1]BBG42538.1 hypothetical protein MCAL160E_0215 [Mycoplasmopsis californica]BBG43113.1 hypothetical protein MCAL160L_0215 [Mycoplasmopsis californica]